MKNFMIALTVFASLSASAASLRNGKDKLCVVADTLERAEKVMNDNMEKMDYAMNFFNDIQSTTILVKNKTVTKKLLRQPDGSIASSFEVCADVSITRE